jgi:hypothetical protein
VVVLLFDKILLGCPLTRRPRSFSSKKKAPLLLHPQFLAPSLPSSSPDRFRLPSCVSLAPLLPFFCLAPVFRPLAPPMQLTTSRPSSAPLPLNNDFAPLHSTNLSLHPSSAWRLPTFPCALFPLDDDSVTFDSMALSLCPLFRPTTLQFSARRFFPCACLPPGGSQHLFVPLFRRTAHCTPLFDSGPASSQPASPTRVFTSILPAVFTFDRAHGVCALPLVRWTRALKEALLN